MEAPRWAKNPWAMTDAWESRAAIFWQRVSVPQKPYGCWEWPAGKVCGYGSLMFCGRRWRSHRLAYTLTHGEIPEGLIIRHVCDNPSCCNPHHLLMGTQMENVQDSISRGRHVHGETHGRAKLCTEDVFAIRSLLEQGISQYALAARFGVARTTIADIKRRKNWSHLIPSV